MKTLTEYERKKVRQARKVLFDVAPLILAFTVMIGML